MLVREIIVNALNELQVYSPGEQVTLIDLARGLQTLNVMLDSWSTENMSCFYVLEQQIVLVPSVAQYTIGPGGTIDTSQGGQRPIRLIDGPGSAYVQDSMGNNYPVAVVQKAQWNAIGNRVVTNSNFPDTIYYDPQFPTAFLNVFPVPNQNNTLFFDAYAQLSQFSSLDVDINLPPGYAEALQKNLALGLKPYFPIAVLDPQTVRLAAISKANIKRANSGTPITTYDGELVPSAPGTYNIYTDGYNANSRG